MGSMGQAKNVKFDSMNVEKATEPVNVRVPDGAPVQGIP